MNKVLVGIVLYNPNLELLYQNICAYIDVDCIGRIYIWDNSASSTRAKNREYLEIAFVEKSDIFVFEGDGQNRGLAFAYNEICRYAEQQGYAYVMTMDQDSVFENADRYIQEVMERNRSKGYCICGPNAYGVSFSTADNFVSMPSVIGSGMLYPTHIAKICGGYDTHFKVDAIDVEFCYHARSLGYPVYLVNNAHLKQQFGHSRPKHFLGRDWVAKNYPPNRIYGIMKNHLIVWRKYGHPRELLYRWFVSHLLIDTFFGVLFMETNKYSKLISAFHGIKDGLFQKLNK